MYACCFSFLEEEWLKSELCNNNESLNEKKGGEL